MNFGSKFFLKHIQTISILFNNKRSIGHKIKDLGTKYQSPHKLKLLRKTKGQELYHVL